MRSTTSFTGLRSIAPLLAAVLAPQVLLVAGFLAQGDAPRKLPAVVRLPPDAIAAAR